MVCLNIFVVLEERLLLFFCVFTNLFYFALNYIYIHEEAVEIQNIIYIKILRFKENYYKFNALKV